VKRFVLSPFASRDVDDVVRYLEQMPERPAHRVGTAIHRMLEQIGDHPLQGAAQSEVTRIMGFEVRSRLAASYRILYRIGNGTPEIIGVIHTSRDIPSIMAKRVQ
jgi:plasmid stabilization system protein ParE